MIPFWTRAFVYAKPQGIIESREKKGERPSKRTRVREGREGTVRSRISCSKLSYGYIERNARKSLTVNGPKRVRNSQTIRFDGTYVERVTFLVVRVTSFFATFSLSLIDGSPCYSMGSTDYLSFIPTNDIGRGPWIENISETFVPLIRVPPDTRRVQR